MLQVMGLKGRVMDFLDDEDDGLMDALGAVLEGPGAGVSAAEVSSEARGWNTMDDRERRGIKISGRTGGNNKMSLSGQAVPSILIQLCNLLRGLKT